MTIDVKDAIAIAKRHAAELFAEEGLGGPSLEEIWLDEATQEWCVTVGLRSGLTPDLAAKIQRTLGRQAGETLIYKTVRIDAETGKPGSVTIREPTA